MLSKYCKYMYLCLDNLYIYKEKIKMKKLKKILAAFTASVISAVSLCSTFSANALANKETFRVYVDVPSNSGVADIGLNLRYTPSVTDICTYSKGNVDTDFRLSVVMDDGAYVGVDIWSYAESDMVSPGTICVLAMTAPSSTKNLFDIVDVNIARLTNIAGRNLPTSRLRISNVMVGDVNQDGKVNSEDSTLLSKYLSGSVSLSGDAIRAADTDCDFCVSDADLIRLNKYLNGEIRYFDR